MNYFFFGLGFTFSLAQRKSNKKKHSGIKRVHVKCYNVLCFITAIASYLRFNITPTLVNAALPVLILSR